MYTRTLIVALDPLDDTFGCSLAMKAFKTSSFSPAEI
jgi:hypothetical protein